MIHVEDYHRYHLCYVIVDHFNVFGIGEATTIVNAPRTRAENPKLKTHRYHRLQRNVITIIFDVCHRHVAALR